MIPAASFRIAARLRMPLWNESGFNGDRVSREAWY